MKYRPQPQPIAHSGIRFEKGSHGIDELYQDLLNSVKSFYQNHSGMEIKFPKTPKFHRLKNGSNNIGSIILSKENKEFGKIGINYFKVIGTSKPIQGIDYATSGSKGVEDPEVRYQAITLFLNNNHPIGERKESQQYERDIFLAKLKAGDL